MKSPNLTSYLTVKPENFPSKIQNKAKMFILTTSIQL